MSDSFSNANLQYKDSVFRDYFNDKERLLSLCNSLLHTDYSDLEINTLDTNFFSGLKNDISCKIGNNFLVLVEHQSTINENMPFRFLLYVAELLNNLVENKKVLYSNYLIQFPAPKFFVFYDGVKNEPVKHEMKLSDAFGGSSDLELLLTSINISLEKQAEILKSCSYLKEYSTLISFVRQGLSQKLSRRNSITQAIDRCINQNVMKEYLIRKKEEVCTMLDLQWNLDDAKQVWIEEERNSIALNMLKDGLSFEQVHKFTKLTIEKIEELAKKIHS